MSRALKVIVVVCVLLALLPAGASGKAKMKVLGSDPAGDALPALDLTSVAAGRNRGDLVIEIGVDRMLPLVGGYPALPGIEWIFSSEGRTFLAEAYIATTRPRFLLFELHDDGYEQLGDLEGSYTDGIIRMLVPLKTIDATEGTKIAGVVGDSGGDADAHVHLGPQTYYADSLKTTKSYIVP